MSKHMVELEWETIQSIIVKELKEDLTQLQSDLESRKQGEGMSIWSHDPEVDCMVIQQHIDALEKVIDYYGG